MIISGAIHSAGPDQRRKCDSWKPAAWRCQIGVEGGASAARSRFAAFTSRAPRRSRARWRSPRSAPAHGARRRRRRASRRRQRRRDRVGDGADAELEQHPQLRAVRERRVQPHHRRVGAHRAISRPARARLRRRCARHDLRTATSPRRGTSRGRPRRYAPRPSRPVIASVSILRRRRACWPAQAFQFNAGCVAERRADAPGAVAAARPREAAGDVERAPPGRGAFRNYSTRADAQTPRPRRRRRHRRRWASCVVAVEGVARVGERVVLLALAAAEGERRLAARLGEPPGRGAAGARDRGALAARGERVARAAAGAARRGPRRTAAPAAAAHGRTRAPCDARWPSPLPRLHLRGRAACAPPSPPQSPSARSSARRQRARATPLARLAINAHSRPRS